MTRWIASATFGHNVPAVGVACVYVTVLIPDTCRRPFAFVTVPEITATSSFVAKSAARSRVRISSIDGFENSYNWRDRSI